MPTPEPSTPASPKGVPSHAHPAGGPDPTSPTHRAALAGLAAALLLAACAIAPPRPAGADRPASPVARPLPRAMQAPGLGVDGPEAIVPPDLMLVPDAQPRLEPVRQGGPNKPYEVLGQAYTPLAGDPPLVERGLASWYGRKFHGRATASGETYNMYAMSAAHKTMPLPSYARVRNPANGRAVVVRINDRGPFHPGRVIDLSYTAALQLGLLGGVAAVEVERITQEAIRNGSWRQAPPADSALAQAAVPANPAMLPTLRADPPPMRPVARKRPVALDDPIGDLLQRTAAANQAAEAAKAQEAYQGEPLPPETAAPAQAAAKAAPGFWLQLGAFAQRDGALGFQQRVATEADWLAPLLTVFNERSLHRLQAGPYGSRAQAQAAAQRLRVTLQLVPAVVERR